ncbi:MAG TPA: hypothetical protein VLB44_12415 [Kofleriaceae bacterium]|nr:hypothetical protein [Kofleriaceae bacterium]
MRALPFVLLAACHGTVQTASSDAGEPPYTQMLPDGPCAIEGITGPVAGVSLSIRGATCVIHRGIGATFTFEVTTNNVPVIAVPGSGGGCGPCAAHSADPLTFIVWNIYGTSPGGAEQRYCECDGGCCPPTTDATVQVTSTTIGDTITWSGRTWSGPSDTNNPMGDFFLPGRYGVFVAFIGYDQGETVATLPIEVIEP